MANHTYCVIMAGGGGTRFWPISRESNPKQFQVFSGMDGRSFLREAYDTAAQFLPPENILIITLDRFADRVREQIPELDEQNLLLEPYARNTAPCMAYATYRLLKKDPDAVLVASPSDLLVDDSPRFGETLRTAVSFAVANKALVTLGVIPSRPDPNFGYIQVEGGQSSIETNVPIKVKTFTEKPDETLAEVFLKSGEFLWNAGIFIARARVLRSEMEKHIPQITKLFKGWEKAMGTPAEGPLLQKIYGDMDKISLDHGVMEKTDLAWVIPARFSWTDIGNWESLYDYFPDKDEQGNIVTAVNSIIQDSKDNIFYSSDEKKLLMIKGMENFVVIDTPDALMICPRDEAKLKELISHLGLPGYEDYR